MAKKKGRPPKPENERLTSRIPVLMHPEEEERLRRAVSHTHFTSMSAIIRKATIDYVDELLEELEDEAA